MVTIGGASVGDYDLVQKALVDAGMGLSASGRSRAAGEAAAARKAGAMQGRARPARQSDVVLRLRRPLAPADRRMERA